MKYKVKTDPNGFEMGPYEMPDLESKLRSGAIGRNYIIKTDGEFAWHPISSVVRTDPPHELFRPATTSEEKVQRGIEGLHPKSSSSQKTTTSERDAYGGFWLRAGACFVDMAVILLPSLLARSLAYYLIQQTLPSATVLQIQVTGFCVSLLISWTYYASFLSSAWQATVGKRVCSLKVVDYDGKRISFGRATGRYFGAWLSSLPLGIGFLMITWTRRRQALHDFLAETLVIKAEPTNPTSA